MAQITLTYLCLKENVICLQVCGEKAAGLDGGEASSRSSGGSGVLLLKNHVLEFACSLVK